MKYKLLLFLTGLFLFNLSPILAAQQTAPTNNSNQNTQNQQQNQANTQVNKPSVTGSSQMNQNQNQNRIRACQAVEGGIKTRSTTMTQFAYKLMETLGTMNSRTEDYYQRKVASQTKANQVPNYEALKTKVQEKKMVALQANTQAQNSLLNFDCTSENSADAVKSFNAYMTQTKTALKDYKNAVKNLSEAVKTAAKKGGQE